jgi:hypothetical protein
MPNYKQSINNKTHKERLIEKGLIAKNNQKKVRGENKLIF